MFVQSAQISAASKNKQISAALKSTQISAASKNTQISAALKYCGQDEEKKRLACEAKRKRDDFNTRYYIMLSFACGSG